MHAFVFVFVSFFSKTNEKTTRQTQYNVLGKKYDQRKDFWFYQWYCQKHMSDILPWAQPQFQRQQLPRRCPALLPESVSSLFYDFWWGRVVQSWNIDLFYVSLKHPGFTILFLMFTKNANFTLRGRNKLITRRGSSMEQRVPIVEHWALSTGTSASTEHSPEHTVEGI